MFRIDKDDNSIKPLKARSFLGGGLPLGQPVRTYFDCLDGRRSMFSGVHAYLLISHLTVSLRHTN